MFLIGGGASASADVYLDAVREHFKQYAFSVSRETPIEVASLGIQVQAISRSGTNNIDGSVYGLAFSSDKSKVAAAIEAASSEQSEAERKAPV